MDYLAGSPVEGVSASVPESRHGLRDVGEPVVNVSVEMVRNACGVDDNLLGRLVSSNEAQVKRFTRQRKIEGEEWRDRCKLWCPAAARKARRE